MEESEQSESSDQSDHSFRISYYSEFFAGSAYTGSNSNCNGDGFAEPYEPEVEAPLQSTKSREPDVFSRVRKYYVYARIRPVFTSETARTLPTSSELSLVSRYYLYTCGV